MVFSIVIPTKDRPDSLKVCLDSIHKQIRGKNNIEIIVVDDGSETGKSIENQFICKQNDAIFLRHAYNRKMAVARNTGAHAARGTWIIFLDDDIKINDSWIDRLIDLTKSISNEVAGIEGKVIPSGGGVWDREVSNLKGGAYLTCHFIIRKNMFDRLSGFDSEFEHLGPFCEDHEFAARALWHGKIIFDGSLSVTHLPRKINLIKYLKKSRERIRGLLKSEFYFYFKHPDRYHLFRSSRTFWGTYIKIMTRNFYSDLKRRKTAVLLKHPIQSIVMLLSSIIEQIEAIILLPYFINKLRKENDTIFISLDKKRTTELWHLKNNDISIIKLKQDYFRSITFKFTHKPDNSIICFTKKIKELSELNDCKVLLRIDDVFINKKKAVDCFSEIMKEKSINFVAAITGDDIKVNENSGIIDKLMDSGAEIGIHGFNHKGKFGPFDSELMQLSYPEFSLKINDVFSSLNGKKIKQRILVPPFNSIGAEQIKCLATIFDVICGGPETMRFSNRIAGATAIIGGGWYVPSLFPFYSSSENILSSNFLSEIGRLKGFYCITVHFTDEEKNGFTSLSKLIDKISPYIASWGIFKRDQGR